LWCAFEVDEFPGPPNNLPAMGIPPTVCAPTPMVPLIICFIWALSLLLLDAQRQVGVGVAAVTATTIT
jgi:hypothetical protein